MPNFIDVNSGERPLAQALNGHNKAAISNIDRLFQGMGFSGQHLNEAPDPRSFLHNLLNQADLGNPAKGPPPLQYITSSDGLLGIISEQTKGFKEPYVSPTGLTLTPCGKLLSVGLPPGLAQRNNSAVRAIFDPDHPERSYGHVACGEKQPSAQIFGSYLRALHERIIRTFGLNILRQERIGTQGQRVMDTANMADHSLIACGLDVGNGQVVVQIMPRHSAALGYMGGCLQGLSSKPISEIIAEDKLLAIVFVDTAGRQAHWNKVNEFRKKNGSGYKEKREPNQQEQVLVHDFAEPRIDSKEPKSAFGSNFKGMIYAFCQHPGTAVKKAVFGSLIYSAIRDRVNQDGNPFFPWHGSAAKWQYSHHNVFVELTGEAGSGKTELWYNLAWLNSRRVWLDRQEAGIIDLYKDELSSWGLKPKQFAKWLNLIPNGVDGRGDDILLKLRDKNTGQTWVSDIEKGPFHRPDVQHEILGVQQIVNRLPEGAAPIPVAGYGLKPITNSNGQAQGLEVDLTDFKVNPRMCIPGGHIPGRSSEPLRPQLSIIGVRGAAITESSSALCNAAIHFISRASYAALQAKTPTAGKGDNNPSAILNKNDGLIKGTVGSIGDFVVPSEHSRAYLQMLRVMIPPTHEQVVEGGIQARHFVAARGAIGTRANLNTVGVGALMGLCRDTNWEGILSNPDNLIWTDPLGGFCLKASATDPLMIDGELFRPWEQKGLGVDKWWESREILHRFELEALKEHLKNINKLPEVRAGKVNDIARLGAFIEEQIYIISHWLENSQQFKNDFVHRIRSDNSALPEDQKMQDIIRKQFQGQVNF